MEKNTGKEYISKFAKDLKNPDVEMKVLALGMGMQSTALYLMSSMGLFERADVAIFSDPMSEHPETYKLAEWLVGWSKECGDAIPIHIVKKDLYNDVVNPMRVTSSGYNKYTSIPAYTKDEQMQKGMLKRHCTSKYKIEPLEKKVRELMGLKPRQRWKPCEMWLGITIDEAQRMKVNPNYNRTNRYPFLEMMMTRGDCMRFMEENGFPIPVKSACVFCPYHSDSFWLELKKENGSAWKKSVALDYNIRKRENVKLDSEVFLHSSCKPLDEVDFKENQIGMFENECEGHCGI